MKGLEALKRIRQETCPATYMTDFDKNDCCDIIEKELKALNEIKVLYTKWLGQKKSDYEFFTKLNEILIKHNLL